MYLRLAGYLLGAILLATAGYKIGANRWETKYQALRAEDFEGQAKREAVARMALQNQLRDAQTTRANNEAVLHDLQTTTAAIAADRDRTRELAQRLLNSARTRASARHVPEAADRPAAPDPGETGSDVEAGELLTDASAECRGNAAQLNSLIAQLKPQL